LNEGFLTDFKLKYDQSGEKRFFCVVENFFVGKSGYWWEKYLLLHVNIAVL